MKKQLSVFGLYARAALTRLLSAVPGLLALDLLAYGWCAARGVYSDLEPALQLMFGIGLTGLQLLLVSCFGTNSRYRYTLRRLRISERGAFIWSFVCNALCYAALWCVQIMAAAGAVFWRAAADSYAQGPQGVFVTFYRNSFLHGLLPLADGYVWARNALLVLALGSITACMQLALRRKDGARWLALMGLTQAHNGKEGLEDALD